MKIELNIEDKYVDDIFVMFFKTWNTMKCGGGPPVPLDLIESVLDQIRKAKPHGDTYNRENEYSPVSIRNVQTPR